MTWSFLYSLIWLYMVKGWILFSFRFFLILAPNLSWYPIKHSTLLALKRYQCYNMLLKVTYIALNHRYCQYSLTCPSLLQKEMERKGTHLRSFLRLLLLLHYSMARCSWASYELLQVHLFIYRMRDGNTHHIGIFWQLHQITDIHKN